jgi:hypothetical protein
MARLSSWLSYLGYGTQPPVKEQKYGDLDRASLPLRKTNAWTNNLSRQDTLTDLPADATPLACADVNAWESGPVCNSQVGGLKTFFGNRKGKEFSSTQFCGPSYRPTADDPTKQLHTGGPMGTYAVSSQQFGADDDAVLTILGEADALREVRGLTEKRKTAAPSPATALSEQADLILPILPVPSQPVDPFALLAEASAMPTPPPYTRVPPSTRLPVCADATQEDPSPMRPRRRRPAKITMDTAVQQLARPQPRPNLQPQTNETNETNETNQKPLPQATSKRPPKLQLDYSLDSKIEGCQEFTQNKRPMYGLTEAVESQGHLNKTLFNLFQQRDSRRKCSKKNQKDAAAICLYAGPKYHVNRKY